MKLNLIQYLLFALFINYKMLFSLFVISETPFFCHSRSRRLSGIQELAAQSLFTAYQETNLAKKVYKHNKYYTDSFFLFFNLPAVYSWISPESIRDGNDKRKSGKKTRKFVILCQIWHLTTVPLKTIGNP